MEENQNNLNQNPAQQELQQSTQQAQQEQQQAAQQAQQEQPQQVTQQNAQDQESVCQRARRTGGREGRKLVCALYHPYFG